MESEALYSKPGQDLNLVLLQPTDDTAAAAATNNVATAPKSAKLAAAPSVAALLDEEKVFAPPPPPDGGFGWFVVLGAFFVNVLCDGTCFSFAIFLDDLQNHFDEAESTIAWVGSSLVGCYLLIGPCAGALADKFGCRVVCMAGAFVASAAIILSIFSPNVYVLIVLYGVMGGVGMGLSYLPSIVIVGLYFEKRRATATGISVCGSGVGCFVIAPLMTTLLQAYGWQGSFLISAGLMLNCAVCGALFRPLKSHKVQTAVEPQETKVFELEPAATFVADPNPTNFRGGIARRHLDSTNLSDVSSIFDSNKSIVFGQSRVTIMEPLDEALGEAEALRLRNSRAMSPSGRRHRVVSLCDDGGGGGGSGAGVRVSSNRVLRLISSPSTSNDDRAGEDGADDVRDDADLEVVIVGAGNSSSSSVGPPSASVSATASRPRSPVEKEMGFAKRNLERIPEVKSQKTIRSRDTAEDSEDDGKEKREGVMKRRDAGNELNDDSNRQNDLNDNSERVDERTVARDQDDGADLPRQVRDDNSDNRVRASKSETEANGRLATTTTLSSTRGNIGFKPLDDLDMKALQLTGGPKRLGSSTRETATVATGLTNYYLVESQQKKRNEVEPSNYWQKKKDLASPEGSQLTLHAIPANVSMKWIDSVGSIPHPEVVLKYRTPNRLQRTTSSVSRGEKNLPPLAKKDIFYSRSIMSVNHYQSMRSGIAQVDGDDEDDDGDDDDKIDRGQESVHDEHLVTRKKSSCNKCWRNFQGLIDCSLMKSPTFVLYSISGMLVMIAMTVVYMFLMKYGDSRGLKQEKTKWFISIIGITNTLCRIFIGLIADAPWADVVHITTVSMGIGALGSILLPFVATTFALISVYCCVFAFSIACFVSLRSIVMVQLFGLEKLTNSFGISLLFQGVSSLMGPPIAGKLFELTGTYTVSFVCTGLCFLVAALLHGPIRAIAKCEANAKQIRSAAKASLKDL